MEAAERRSLGLSIEQYGASEEIESRILAWVTMGQGAALVLLFLTIRGESNSRSEMGFQLLQNNVRLFAVLETIGEGLYQLDREGRLVYLNAAGEEILGYSHSEIWGKPIHDVIQSVTPDGAPRSASACELLDVIRSGSAVRRFRDFFQRKDGSFVAVECTSKALSMAGNIEGAVLCFRDITERKRFEEALKESEERYRTLVEKSEGLICTHDLNGTLLSINEAAAEIFGKIPAEIVGKNLREFLVTQFRPQLDGYLEKSSIGACTVD